MGKHSAEPKSVNPSRIDAKQSGKTTARKNTSVGASPDASSKTVVSSA